MNPVIATSLINLGSNIIHNAFPGPTASDKVLGNDFDKDLRGILSRETPAHEDFNLLREEVLASPGLKDFLSRNKGNSITLDQMADGSVRLLSSSGDFMTLHIDHPSCEVASQFLRSSLAAGKNLNQQRPNSVYLTG